MDQAFEFSSSDREIIEEVIHFDALFRTASGEYRFFVSAGGHFGLAPVGSQPGDLVCIFAGVRIPYIDRPKEVVGISGDEHGICVDPSREYVLVGGGHHYGIWEGSIELDVDELVPYV